MSQAQVAEVGSITSQSLQQQQPVDELDTETGTPDEPMDLEAEADGAEAATEDDDYDESDTDDDGTPDDEESEGGSYEQRFKDTQAKLTETSQTLSALKAEYTQSVGQITEARLDLEEKLGAVDQEISFWEQVVQSDLQQLQQYNPQQMSQEQYAMWQQQMSAANMRAQQVYAARQQHIERANAARESAISKEVAVARKVLSLAIDNFDDVYPEIGQFAVESGVNPRVFKEITDPGLIRILHKAMIDAQAPDAIEKVVTKTQAKRRPARNANGRFARSKPKTLAERLYGDK